MIDPPQMCRPFTLSEIFSKAKRGAVHFGHLQPWNQCAAHNLELVQEKIVHDEMVTL